MPIVGRKAAADIEGLELMTVLGSAMHQLAAHVDGLHVHSGIDRLRSHVERQSLYFDAQIGREPE